MKVGDGRIYFDFCAVRAAARATWDIQQYEACQSAIRQILMMNIYKDVRENPEVKKAIDVAMKYQQEYQCIKR
jgi:hypothetical protein